MSAEYKKKIRCVGCDIALGNGEGYQCFSCLRVEKEQSPDSQLYKSSDMRAYNKLFRQFQTEIAEYKTDISLLRKKRENILRLGEAVKDLATTIQDVYIVIDIVNDMETIYSPAQDLQQRFSNSGTLVERVTTFAPQ